MLFSAATPRARALLLLVLGAGCLNAPVYRTARTLGRGEVDLGLTISGTRMTIAETVTPPGAEPGSGVTERRPFLVPNLVPEVSLHYGATDDLELGGRLAASSLMVELDMKLRVLGHAASRTHVALQPSFGYRTLIFMEGVHANLPLIITHDLTPGLALNLAPYVGYLSYSAGASIIDEQEELRALFIKALLSGASVGVQLRVGNGYFMPALDYARVVRRFDVRTGDRFAAEDWVVFSITIGGITNRLRGPGAGLIP